MIDAREPKDGDFIAYVDRLEREFAARNVSSIAADAAASSAPHLREQTAPRDPFKAAIDKRILGEANLPNALRIVAGAAACVIGAIVLLVWFFSHGLRWSFLIGAALIAWGASQLLRALGTAKADAKAPVRRA